MFQDEAGFGRINKPKYCWSQEGIRPSGNSPNLWNVRSSKTHIYTKRMAIWEKFLFKLQKILKNGDILLKIQKISSKMYHKAGKGIAPVGQFSILPSALSICGSDGPVNRRNF